MKLLLIIRICGWWWIDVAWCRIGISKTGSSKSSGFIYRQLLVDLEIPSKDKSYLWFWNGCPSISIELRHLSVETNVITHDNGAITTNFSLVPGPGNI